MPKKRQKMPNFAKNRSKTIKKVAFGRESDSKQEKPKENSKKHCESKEKSSKNA